MTGCRVPSRASRPSAPASTPAGAGRWSTVRWPNCSSGARSRASSPPPRRSRRASRWWPSSAPALADAVSAGQLGPGANAEEAIYLVSTMIAGVLTQAFANEPGLSWGEGRFTPLFPKLMGLLPAAFPLPG